MYRSYSKLGQGGEPGRRQYEQAGLLCVPPLCRSAISMEAGVAFAGVAAELTEIIIPWETKPPNRSDSYV